LNNYTRHVVVSTNAHDPALWRMRIIEIALIVAQYVFVPPTHEKIFPHKNMGIVLLSRL
jgi:hypothetical protein